MMEFPPMKSFFLVKTCYNKTMFKNNRFDPKKFKLGLRTLKSGIAVFLVILLFKLVGWQGMNIAALTAVFSLREDFDKSVHFGASRILGNSIGGFYAVLFFVVSQYFNEAFWVTLILVPICAMLTIMTNVAVDNKAGVIGAVSAMLIITLSMPSGGSIQYAIVRVFETFVGVFIAMLVNYDLEKLKSWLKKPRKPE